MCLVVCLENINSKNVFDIQIERDVVATIVSTVASKSAFCIGGHILDEYRSFMTPNMVEALILTQNWL